MLQLSSVHNSSYNSDWKMELLRGAYKTTSVQQQTSVPEQQNRAAHGGVFEKDACTNPHLCVLTWTKIGSSSIKICL